MRREFSLPGNFHLFLLVILLCLFSTGIVSSGVYAQDTYTLTVEIEPHQGGSVLVDGDTPVDESDSFVFNDGDTVELEAVEAEFWKFDAWTGDAESGESEIEITMDGDKTITAEFERKQYNLTVNVNGEGIVLVNGSYFDGDTHLTKKFDAGETLDIEARADEHWYFEEWTDIAGGRLEGSDPKQQIFFDTNLEEVANFEKFQYTLEVDIEGTGEVLVDGQTTVDENESFIFDPEDTVTLRAVEGANPHWKFNEWSVDAEGSDTEIVIEMNRDKVARANFERRMYELTVAVDSDSPLESGLVYVGGETVGEFTTSDTFEFESESTVELEASPAEYWRFHEWEGDVDDNEAPVTSIEMDEAEKNVTGHFKREEYNLVLELNPDEGGEVQVEGVGNVTENDTLTFESETEVELTAQAAPHWNFDNWSGAVDSSDTTISLEMTTDRGVSVNFSRKQYTFDLGIEPDEGGEVVVAGDTYHSDETFEFDSESELELEARPADEHWLFDKWSGDTEGLVVTDPELNISLDTDMELTAHFKRDTYILTVEVEPEEGGRVEVGGFEDTPVQSTDTFVFESEEVVGLEAIPVDKHWLFENWSEDLEGTENPSSVEMIADRTVRANFSRKIYRLTVEASPSAGGSVQVQGDGVDTTVEDSGQFEFESETFVELEADTTDRHWYFEGWSGDTTATASAIEIQVTGDSSVVANFNRESYKLTVKVEPPGGGSVDVEPDNGGWAGTVSDTREEFYDSETEIDLEAQRAGTLWEFVEWTGSTELLTEVSSRTTKINLDTDAVVVANFNEIEIGIHRPFSGQLWGDTTKTVKIDYSSLSGDFILVEMDGRSSVELELELSDETRRTEQIFTELQPGKEYEVRATIYGENEALVTDTTVFEIDLAARTFEFDEVESPKDRITYTDETTGLRKILLKEEGIFEGEGAISISSSPGQWSESIKIANDQAGERYSDVYKVADESLARIEYQPAPGQPSSDTYIMKVELAKGNPADFDIYRLNRAKNEWSDENIEQLEPRDNLVRVRLVEFSEFQFLLQEDHLLERSFQNFKVGPNPVRVADWKEPVIFQFENYDEYEAGEEKVDFELNIYTVTGREVDSRRFTEISEIVDDEYYQLHWEGAGSLSTGHYIYRLEDKISGDYESGQIVITR